MDNKNNEGVFVPNPELYFDRQRTIYRIWKLSKFFVWYLL